VIEAVRRATDADRDALAGLEADARLTMAHERGGPERLAEVAEAGATGWAARIADPDWFVLIATIDDIPLGYVSAELRDDSVVVEAIWVEPDARELGLGEALLTSVLEAARSRGARTAEAVALPGDRSTKNLFERFGMKARALIVGKRLDEPESD